MREKIKRPDNLPSITLLGRPRGTYWIRGEAIKRPLLWSLLFWLGYGLIFFLLYPLWGWATTLLSALPVMFVAWLWGFRAGTLAGLLSLPLTLIMLSIVNLPDWSFSLLSSAGASTLVAIFLGGSVGYLRDLRRQLIAELYQRQETDQKLRQSEERYRQIVEDQTDLIVRWLPDGTRLFVNDAYCQHFEQTKDEMIGSSFFPLIHEEDRAEIWHKIASLSPSNPTAVDEHRTLLPDGSIAWHRWIDRAFFDEKGNLVELQSVGRDISEEKLARDQLYQSEMRYRRLFENALVGVFRSTPNGRFQQVNPALVQMLGYDSAEELMTIYLPNDLYLDAAERAKLQAKYEPEGTMKGVEMTWKRKDGQKITVRLHGRTVRNELGTVQCYEGLVRDITQQKQIEEALIQEKAFVDAIIDSLPGVFYLFDQEGKFLRWNENLEQVTGYASDDLAQMHPLRLIEPSERDKVSQAIQQVFDEGEAVIESYLLSKDGSTNPYLLTGRRILLKDEPVLSGLGIDISARKMTEERLRQSESNLRAIFNNTLQAFVLFDTQRRVLAANSVAHAWALRILGHSLEIGKQADELFAQFQLDNFLHLFEQVLQQETISQQRKITANNQIFWFESNYNPVINEAGTVVGVSLSVLNITGRKQAEEALNQSKTELQHILDSVPEGVLLLLADGTIRLTNPVADSFLAILAPDYQHARLSRLGQRSLAELLTSPPQGLWHEIEMGEYTFEAIARPVENSATSSGWVMVLRDITQERDIQRRVRRQERLAAVGQLAAGIAHDFNNILAVITLYSELLTHTGELSDQALVRVHTIQEQTKRATDLVQQILDFSRQSVIERRPLDLRAFLEEMVGLLTRTLPENIQVVLAEDEHECTIQADPSRIQQIIMNLAINARDAMPEGGVLRFNLAEMQTNEFVPLSLQNLPPGKWVQIEVSDNGTGITAEMLPHIFEPFFTTKEVGQGSGLGLAQVYGIVQQHEGYINVETTIGQGTAFTMYFPSLQVEENITPGLEQSNLQFGRGQRILVVEDDEATRNALLDSLALLNYEVEMARNGREALGVLAAQGDKISLVLSDTVMPEMGGIALFHSMREQQLTTPIVLLTGHPLSNELESLRALGLAGWLSKPPSLINLSHLLASALEYDD